MSLPLVHPKIMRIGREEGGSVRNVSTNLPLGELLPGSATNLRTEHESPILVLHLHFITDILRYIIKLAGHKSF